MEKILVGCLLCIEAFRDLKTRKISLAVLSLFGGIGIVWAVTVKHMDFAGLLSGTLVGIFVIFLSVLTKGGIGTGDGILLIVTGVYLGAWRNLELYLFGTMLSAIFSILMLVFRKAKKKDTMPFVPFLLFGYLGVMLL